jgi:endogenous inhibitor of DNA gyrase (YacG/DUF329 family)
VTREPKPKGQAAVVPMRPPRKCPVCGRPAVRAFYPFDSKRCADTDLSRWLTGAYVIPAADETPGSEATREDDGEA